MTGREKQGIKALSNCTFLPGSFEKRIAGVWHGKLESAPHKRMTDKGKACLWELVYRFRRQIADTELIDFADSQNKHNKRGRWAK